MSDITNIDDYRPHINTQDPVTGIRHVMPVAMIDDMAAGRLPVQDDEVMPRQNLNRKTLWNFQIIETTRTRIGKTSLETLLSSASLSQSWRH